MQNETLTGKLCMRFDALVWNSWWSPPEHLRKLLALLLLLAFSMQGAIALREMSSTGDETHYLGMGRYLIRTCRWDLPDSLLHPPLSYYLQNAAIGFVPIDFRVFDMTDINARGRALMAASADDRLLHLARAPVLVLAVFLGLLVLVWGWQAGGSAAGLFALFLYAFSPAILSSAALITPDLCLTFFSTLTFYALWRYLKRPAPAKMLLAGLALGLTLLSKYTGILSALAIVVIVCVQAISHRRPHDAAAGGKPRLRHLAILFLAAILVVDAGYFFIGTFRFLDGAAFRSHLFQSVAATGILHWIPSPLPRAYVMGVDMQYTVLENGFRYFMLGKVQSQGFFLYYVVAFFTKSPVPFLLLIWAALMFRRKGENDRALEWVLLVPAVIFVAYFSFTRVSRGIRYILPIYPLLFLWVSQAAIHYARRMRRFMPVLAALALWYAGSCLSIAPHYLAYFNELSGGPRNGRNILDESDFDWGQDLGSLGKYLREHDIRRIQLSYFGTADPGHYGISYDPLPCDPVLALRSNEPIAVSATAMHWDCNRWLEGLEPADSIGYTILLFNLPPAPSSPKPR
jgi:4-amino-4-deoxy-L-arabinose transferase-like glycosyltransferase